MRKSDNSLHFFINGVHVGKEIKTIPPVLYGVVDVFGQAEEVIITGAYFSFLPASLRSAICICLKLINKNMDKFNSSNSL